MSDAPSSLNDLQALLRLQEKDSAIDGLLHRRSTLPGHAAMEEVQRKAAGLRPKLAEATSKRDAVAARQAKLEAEAGAIERRIAEINGRLYGSTSVGAKDAQAMSEEVTHLGERRRVLEDGQLEAMEELEPLQSHVEALEAEARDLSTELQQAQQGLKSDQAEIDAELQRHRADRDELAAAVPKSLLTEYERLRPSMSGVAVAPLVGGSCGGCHLTLAASELAALKKAPESAVIHCEECGRILVR